MVDQIFYTEGAGNSFYLSFDSSVSFSKLESQSALNGDKPDGYIICSSEDILKSNRLKWFFYNNDGQEAEFCGNALRAVGLCVQKAFGLSHFEIETRVGVFKINVISASEVKVEMPVPVTKGNINIDEVGLPSRTVCIDAGVPHLVFAHNAPHKLENLRPVCEKLRACNLNGWQDKNLTFYSAETLECVTYERGVEDFTLACGSGALAVAHVVGETKTSLQMPGGVLEVIFDNEKAFMTGPAKINTLYSWRNK